MRNFTDDFQRIAPWSALATVGLAGFSVGLVAVPLLGGVDLESGLATLVGSALGAGITVAGSMWVARYQTTARERSFGKFVADAAGAVKEEAYILISLVGVDHWDDAAVHAEKIKSQINNLKSSLELFVANSPFSGVGNYEARRCIASLEREIQTEDRVFRKELAWLDTPTDAVLNNSRADLTTSAARIFEACVLVEAELGSKRELPSDKEIARRLYVALG